MKPLETETAPPAAAVEQPAGPKVGLEQRHARMLARMRRLLGVGLALRMERGGVLGQPLQIGKGGLREGVILSMLNGHADGTSAATAA